MKFPTHAVLSTSTGILMEDIGGVYDVISYLVGRPIMTHEIPYYGRAARQKLLEYHPELPFDIDQERCFEVRDDFISIFGEEFDLNPELESILNDDKHALQTILETVNA